MDNVTQELIDTLVDLLKTHPAAALQTLTVGAPALIESLEAVKLRAVDRREVSSNLQLKIAQWLKAFPQSEAAHQALLGLPEALDLPAVVLPHPIQPAQHQPLTCRHRLQSI
ncbi:hypothetical protein [Pseudomonas caricapapayae]|nr:hypothetical protein [Pseudomonas caricapapayae]